MAVSYVWPTSLPQAVRPNYSETSGALIVRTPMEAGPAKMRRRGKRPDTLAVGFFMSASQVATLRTFVETTLGGTARFGFPHPRTGTQAEVRIVPSDDGTLFSTAYISADLYAVDLALEVLP